MERGSTKEKCVSNIQPYLLTAYLASLHIILLMLIILVILLLHFELRLVWLVP